MVAPGWCGKYMRAQYKDRGRGPSDSDGFDCWGFVRFVLRSEFGITDLPDLSREYASAEDRDSVAETVNLYKRVLAANWRPVAEPGPGDIVILKIAGRPWHCGVIAGGDWMMHMLRGVNVSLEHFAREPWRNRIEGFYRHE